MQLLSKRRLLILLGLFILLLIISASLFGHKSKNNNESAGLYQDPLSHQTVSNPAGKGPDIYGTTPEAPIYLGAEALLDHGLAFDQLTNLKAAFYAYSKSQPKLVTEISIDVDHINAHHDPHVPNSPFLLQFNVRFDRKNTYKAEVKYSGLGTIQLSLTDPATNKQVFISNTIGIN
jgi:hypothetical protein